MCVRYRRRLSTVARVKDQFNDAAEAASQVMHMFYWRTRYERNQKNTNIQHVPAYVTRKFAHAENLNLVMMVMIALRSAERSSMVAKQTRTRTSRGKCALALKATHSFSRDAYVCVCVHCTRIHIYTPRNETRHARTIDDVRCAENQTSLLSASACLSWRAKAFYFNWMIAIMTAVGERVFVCAIQRHDHDDTLKTQCLSSL